MKTLLERIEEKYVPVPESGCWLWTGCLTNFDYGTICVDGVSRRAHRVIWELMVGPIPEGMKVCHKCDTPRCINPDHLFIGTQLENVMDMVSKGRGGNQKKTVCSKGHQFDYTTYRGRRGCSRCKADDKRRRVARNRSKANEQQK